LRDRDYRVCVTTATMYRRERGPRRFGRKLDSGDDGERSRGARSGAPLARGEGPRLYTELLVRGAWCHGTSQHIRPTYRCPCPDNLIQSCRCTQWLGRSGFLISITSPKSAYTITQTLHIIRVSGKDYKNIIYRNKCNIERVDYDITKY
jgi:hypothetical protein